MGSVWIRSDIGSSISAKSRVRVRICVRRSISVKIRCSVVLRLGSGLGFPQINDYHVFVQFCQ